RKRREICCCAPERVANRKSNTGDNAMKAYRTKKSGFTLVEILIVVIILGILAAIVIPQFTNASTDAKKSNMASQLQTLRSQIQLYKLQHNDTAPVLIGSWNAFTQASNAAGALNGTS